MDNLLRDMCFEDIVQFDPLNSLTFSYMILLLYIFILVVLLFYLLFILPQIAHFFKLILGHISYTIYFIMAKLYPTDYLGSCIERQRIWNFDISWGKYPKALEYNIYKPIFINKKQIKHFFSKQGNWQNFLK